MMDPDSNLGDPPPPTERIEGSLALTAVGVMKGASIVRTHDVATTRRFLQALHATNPASIGQNV